VYSKEFLSEIYRKLYTIRVFETRCMKLYRQGFIRGYFHPYLGEEAIAVGICAALGPDDFITSTHRGHGHCIARGGDIKKMTSELLGKKTGYCQGLGGSMHIADFSAGNLGANGIVGGGLPLAAGAALSLSIRGVDAVSVAFASDGASNNGVFCESMNLAAIWNLPLLMVIENNQYAVSTPIEQSTREPNIYKRGIAYGVESKMIDGNNVFEVYESAVEAIKLCKTGKGPVLIEAKTYRHGGHHINDPGAYMPKERLDYYKSKDPVYTAGQFMMDNGGFDEQQVKNIENSVEKAMDEAEEFAKNSPEMTEEEFNLMLSGY